MNIDLKKLEYHYLTISRNRGRQNRLEKELSFLNINQYMNPHFPVPGVRNRSRKQNRISGSLGWIGMLEKAYPNRVFDVPRAFLEDDASLCGYPGVIAVPDEADVLYIGITRNSPGWRKSKKNRVKYEVIPRFKKVYRIYDMLSLHGIVILSQHGLNTLINSIQKDHDENRIFDISIAKAQHDMYAAAMRFPLVYQGSTRDDAHYIGDLIKYHGHDVTG